MAFYEASKNWKHDETIIKINRESCVSIEKVFSSIFSDELDVWNGMCFAFKRYDVTIYKSNPIFIHGGNINVIKFTV